MIFRHDYQGSNQGKRERKAIKGRGLSARDAQESSFIDLRIIPFREHPLMERGAERGRTGQSFREFTTSREGRELAPPQKPW